MSQNLRILPCTLAQANALVNAIHRHHKPVTGHRFSLACFEGTRLCGVAICGRPVARMCDQNNCLEILRCATDGTRNVISKLYGAISTIAKASGFCRVQTYTMPEEGGASLKASGFVFEGLAGGGQWKHTDGKKRCTEQPTCYKWRWAKNFLENHMSAEDYAAILKNFAAFDFCEEDSCAYQQEDIPLC